MLDTLRTAGLGGDRLHDRTSQWLMATARLRDGVAVTKAAAEIAAIGGRLSTAWPASNKDRAFYVERAGQVHPAFRKMTVLFFFLLIGVSVLVLCTACANVANLLLARASARQKEIATRLAIGAGRGRLLRQLLTESLVLGVLGGIGGYALASAGAASIGRLDLPISMPVDLTVSLDSRVMLFCVSLSVLTGVLFGVVPALRATRPDLVGGLKDEGGLSAHGRHLGLRNLLVIGQVTVCMVLLISSGLFLRSLQSAASIEPGFAHRNILMLSFDPSLNRYSMSDTRRLLNSLLTNTRELPGVESAAVTNAVPLNLEGTQNAVLPEDKIGREGSSVTSDIYSVTPGFFDTLGIRMIAGGDFREGVPPEEEVIINEALAVRTFPGQNPVGRRVMHVGKLCRIAGVVATAKSRTIGEDAHPALYTAMAAQLRGNDSGTGMTLVVRTKGDPALFASGLRQIFRTLDPALAVFDVRTMDAQILKALFVPRTAAFLFGCAGVTGILIAMVGLYGVVSFTVVRRTKEIGIRMALGADRLQVLSMVMRKGVTLALAGCVIGLGAALALTRLTASLLYGTSPTDPLTFVVVPLMLVCIAAAASLIPAQRAAGLDPNLTLRHE
jgi:predicted permease